MRRDKRMSELRAAHRHAAKPGLAWDDFFAALANKFPARDLLDTHQVSPKALGSRLALTIEKKMRIENAETERRRRNGKGGRPFRINTIHVHDMALEDVAAEYRRRRHRDLAARRKAERRRAGATSAAGTEDETMLQRSHATFAEAVAAGKAIKQSQIDSLLAAIDNDEDTLADLAAAVRRQPCWRALGEDTLRRTVLLRFNALRDQGRIIDRYEHGGQPRSRPPGPPSQCDSPVGRSDRRNAMASSCKSARSMRVSRAQHGCDIHGVADTP